MELDRERWIRELVRAEHELENQGNVDLSIGYDAERVLLRESHLLLEKIKNHFEDAVALFNDLKGTTLGTIKVYGIAKTQSDFMLFRNSYKMVFSMKRPGQISVRFHLMRPEISQASTTQIMSEDVIEGKIGAFEELIWQFRGHRIQMEALVRYYLTRFIRESGR